ncbi:hypothetical protein SCLCIDRAFT_102639 [Scleroderma citrinum Foug A]|uniref:hAT-like transposase RNase-H fold domain-containing protein n=1 Tax=Scleroderma citrinum Foug A TaxID=1036808 RepID=A0A0C3A7Z8_9AGAM|nr:hypothetical protein SCLCIDRAFT_102639 [Scleroderma citrinum Foug A]
MVLPAMDYIDEAFTTGMLNQCRFDPAIHSAIGLTKRTLNKYYQLTDLSKLYCIALVLHPCHKMEYFKQAKWRADWIADADQLICDTYALHYTSRDINNIMESPANSASLSGDKEYAANIFDNLPSLSRIKPMHKLDELDAYLATGVEV